MQPLGCLSQLPTDIVVCIIALLPARVARLVSRSARDASDGVVMALELAWRRRSCHLHSFHLHAADTLYAMLAVGDRFARVDDLSMDDGTGGTVHRVLQALRHRPRPLRRLSIASDCYVRTGDSFAPDCCVFTADLCSTLAALPRPLERLRLSLPGLGYQSPDVGDDSQPLAGSLRAMAGGLRDLSLGQLDPRALPAVFDAIVAMTALERLELRAPMPSSMTVRALVTALAANPPPAGPITTFQLGRLETLSLTAGCGLDFFLEATDAPSQFGAALAALPSLRSLTVNSFDLRNGDLRNGAALTSLTVTHYGVQASDLALLTGLRSLRAASILPDPDVALGALARLTALTRLELFNSWTEMNSFGFGSHFFTRRGTDAQLRPLLPSLCALQAGQSFVPLLLEAGAPALTELTCSAFLDTEGKSAAAFEAQLSGLLFGSASQKLSSLSIEDLPWAHVADDLRIGLPSELRALTRLEASARMLRPRSLSWVWLRGLFRPDLPDGRKESSKLRHLVVQRCDRHDVAPMLHGLPSLTTLELLGLQGRRANLRTAFAELPSLRELRLSGDELAMLEALDAAARASSVSRSTCAG